MADLGNRGEFLNMAALFEGGLAVVALGLGWIADINPLLAVQWDWPAVLWGLGGSLPMFGLFVVSYRLPIGPLARIKRFLIDMLGPSLAACRWYDLVLLSLLVGFSEELLFRGVLQPWLSQWGEMVGLVGSNVLFGLAHAITPLYAVVAGVMGCYLGVLLNVSGPDKLLAPMLAHAVYDYLAFLMVVAAYRSEQQPAVHDDGLP